MKGIIKFFSFLILTLVFSFNASYGAVYIFPPDYDDIKSSVQNGTTIVTIRENSFTLSSNTYTIYTPSYPNGTNQRLKCTDVPKISCSTGNIRVYGKILGFLLWKNTYDGGKIVNLKKYDVLAESIGNVFRICAPIYSDDYGTFFINYDEYVSDSSGSKNGNSYVIIEVNQICQ